MSLVYCMVSVENMGSGVCSRKQRKIFQFLLFTTVVFVFIYGGMVWYEMHQQLKRTEALALKYQQHQESLSAQLQGIHQFFTSSRRDTEAPETCFLVCESVLQSQVLLSFSVLVCVSKYNKHKCFLSSKLTFHDH